MPGGDRTGPTGMGPMTGRGLGVCGDVQGRGVGIGRGVGFGFGGGRGRGRGLRNRFWATGLTGWQRAEAAAAPAPVTKEQELAALADQVAQFESALTEIRARIDELNDDAT